MARIVIIIYTATLLALAGCLSVRTLSYAEIAKNYEAEGDFQAAISAYYKHINARLESGATTDNPYFYYLLIGDNYLKLDSPEEAKIAYDTARVNHVDSPLLVDRAKILAKYYTARSNFDDAIKLLNEYRELDPTAIDYEIDYTHKQMLEFEDKQKLNQ